MLDMQEAAGSSPAPPTNHEFVLRTAFCARIPQDSATTALSDRLIGPCGFPVGGEIRLDRARGRLRGTLTVISHLALETGS
jgi:hypothetical protein